MKFIAAIYFLAATIGLTQNNDFTNQPGRVREMSVVLFNQKDFTGWTFVTKDNSDPLKTWSVTNGVIHCTGKPSGYLRTTQVYSNYFLTVEWRFVKVAPKEDNTGILVHIQQPEPSQPARSG